MEGYESEKEQVEALKKWWKENGSSTITGVLLGLAVIFGGKAWFSYQDRQAEAASHLYVQFMNGMARNDAAAISKFGDSLVADYSGSPYAALAALGMARQQIEAGELAAARAQLQWALDHVKSDAIKHSARLRMGRLLIAEQDLDAADALLVAAPESAEYAPLYNDLRGDLALARGDREGARQAYALALAVMPESAPLRGLLQAKFDDVANGEGTL